MTWASSTIPSKPAEVKADGGTLSWKQKHGTVYNIYSSKTWPVDIQKAENLMLARQQTDRINIPDDDNRYYAITAMDRYGNESIAAQSADNTSAEKTKLLCNDGIIGILPDWATDAEGILIAESMQGNMIKSVSRKGMYFDVKTLQDGMYQIISMNSKGVKHKLGCVKIKRF